MSRHGRRQTARERRRNRTKRQRRSMRFDAAVSRGDFNARRYLLPHEWEEWVERCSAVGASTVTGLIYV